MGLSAPNPEVFSLFERKDPQEANKGGDTPPLRPPHARPRADYTQLRSPRNAKPRSGKPERGFLPAKATDGNNDCTPFGGPFPRRGSPSPEPSRSVSKGLSPLAGAGGARDLSGLLSLALTESSFGSGRGVTTFQWNVGTRGNPIKGFPHGGEAAISSQGSGRRTHTRR